MGKLGTSAEHGKDACTEKRPNRIEEKGKIHVSVYARD